MILQSEQLNKFQMIIKKNISKIIMKIFLAPRGGGKTTFLIRESAKTQDIIVCENNFVANSIKRIAFNMGLEIPTPITYSDFTKQNTHGKKISGFLIDNVDVLLQQLTRTPIKIVTMSSND